ncbi:2-amino-4-hydroxy-6-hydroxymethyldihydropteridine diphosphokinase [Rhodococcus sp. NPDC058521]|uniref:2-amino-4-hydroxy-6- hydroxymethyldihydropteridine diphosphokinase n=1 Tax=Rhodococcus sp. NPDC058521 TaxID=3346536 RepID=UPI0036659036
MSRAVLSIGSNVGDSRAHLQSVVDALGSRVVGVSGLYATAPWGGVEQQDFLNAVVIAEDSDFDCRQWLRFGQELEAAADRVRVERWGPRTLDVDVITCDDVRSDDPTLTLPHPRAHERAFVLVPWLDVDPDAQLFVGDGPQRVDALLAASSADERAGVRRSHLALRPAS